MAPAASAVVGYLDRPSEHVAPVAPRALECDTARRRYAEPLAARVGGPIKAHLGQQLADLRMLGRFLGLALIQQVTVGVRLHASMCRTLLIFRRERPPGARRGCTGAMATC